MDITWLYAALPWLAILACPLLMMWMMRGGMSGGERGTRHAAGADKKMWLGDSHMNTDAEIEELKTRLAHLEQRHEQDAAAR